MAKGYWIARVDVDDDNAYARYRELNSKAFAKFGARFVVRGPAGVVAKGTPRKHNVVIEFDSYAQAMACYESPEYQAALVFLKDVGPTDLVIVEGYDGPQPA
ncbi:MAG: DUF1330 domain-containing protein [Beijerinckiaceae bacterium]